MYSPFEKHLDALEAEDLAALQAVSEGWYIEYKSVLSNPITIAKSISSFSNTYGGWLFYGIEEKSKVEPVARRFLGISRAEVDSSLQRIRQAVAMHVTPTMHFECKVVYGPCADINLSEDRAVICVQVPKSHLAPHVHKNGVIYRRISDSSEPQPENDRFILDQLWHRADGIRGHYENWIGKDPEFSKRESEYPFLRLLLVCDLWRDRHPWLEMPLNEFREILGSKTGIRVATPFDTAHTTASGFVARQNLNNDPGQLALTWRFDPDLVSEILVPLNFREVTSLEDFRGYFDGYVGGEKFFQLLKKFGHRSPRIVDLNYLFSTLVGIVEIQRKLLKRANWSDPYYFKVRLLNVWRMCPFLDVPAVLEEFSKYGIPVCLDGDLTSPSGTDPETFVEVGNFSKEISEVEEAEILVQSFRLFGPIARVFGIPPWINLPEGSSEKAFYDELQDASNRAMETQKRRSSIR